MSSPFLDRLGKRSKSSHGGKSEKRLAKRLQHQTTPASGALGYKGDFRNKDFLSEAKSTTAASMSLKHEWLNKVEKQALMIGKRPLLHISFVLPSGQAHTNGDFVLLRLSDFQEIVKE